MATLYNWTYKAGSVISGLAPIPNTADDVRPGGYAYISKAGNDLTGNGSRKLPYATMQKAIDTHGFTTLIVGEGFWNQNITTGSIVCDGLVVFDGTGLPVGSKLVNSNGASTRVYGAIVQNYPVFWQEAAGTVRDTILRNITSYQTGAGGGMPVVRCVLWGIAHRNGADFRHGALFYCTLYVCDLMYNAAPSNSNFSAWHSAYATIFHSCRITTHAEDGRTPSYSSFYNCQWKLKDTGSYATFATIAELRAAWNAAYGVTNSFIGCRFADPKFTDAENGDFTLRPDSGCRNMGFDGKYIGPYGVAQTTTQAGAALTNCTIAANGELTFIDTAQPAEILYPLTTFAEEREAGALVLRGLPAWRNGWVISATPQLSGTANAAGEALEAGSMYLAENGSINYNSQMVAAGGRFTAVAGAAAFSTTEGAVVRQILRANHRSTVYVKTHRSRSDQATFDSLNWMEYEAGKKMTCNRAGNTGTGAVLRGNGDPAFDESKAMPIFLMYLLVRVVVWPNGLKS